MIEDTMVWVTIAAMPVDKRPYMRKHNWRFLATSSRYIANEQEPFDTLAVNSEEDEWLDLWDRKDNEIDAMRKSA